MKKKFENFLKDVAEKKIKEINKRNGIPQKAGTMEGHNNQTTWARPPGNKVPTAHGPLLPANPGVVAAGPHIAPPFLGKLPDKEVEKRLKAVEKGNDTTALVEKVGDQYEYTKEFVYLAYASALSNLANNRIPNQSDATNFQFSPFSDAGTLMAYRGFFTNKSIYQSGDPTDYTWQSTSGMTGYTASERYYSVSTKRLEELGNPTKPGNGVTWVVINAGSGIPSAAIWFAERFKINSVFSHWSITAVGPWVGSDFLVDGAIIEAKIAANAVTVNKILNDAINADKLADNAVTTAAIATNAVLTDNIAANAITANEITANAVTANAIAANSIIANKIAANAVTANAIAANSIVAGKIATNAITAGKITAGAIDATKIAANAITANKIAANAITGDKIIATTKITAGTGNNIGVLDGSSNTGNYRIYAGHATPGSAPFRVNQAGVVTIDSGGSSKLVISGDTLEVFNSGTLRVKIGNLA